MRGEGGTNPLSRLRRQLVPLFVACGERVAFGTNPLSRLRRQLSRRESPWQRGQVSSLFVNGRKKPAVKQQTFRPCQSLSLSGEVARQSRDGEGCFRDEPSQSRCARQLSRGASPWQRGQVSSSPVNGRRSQPISAKLFASAKASPFRERWHGEAVTERVVSGTNPLSRLRRQLSRRASPWQKG